MRIPLADFRPLRQIARRTRLVQLGAAAAAVLLAGGAVLAAARLDPRRPPYLPSGSEGIVVLDVSASISSDTYARIAETLSQLAGSGGRYGLVLVSDTAYQAVPPGTPARELRRFERFFRAPPRRGTGALPELPRNPWTDAFSAGTRLSTGLQVALETVRRKRLLRPAVLLVSDLDDDTADLEAFASSAVALRREGAQLQVVSLNAAPEDVKLVRRFLARPSSLTPALLPGEAGHRAPGSRLPLALSLVAVLVSLALAGVLRLTERLRWRPA